MTVEENAIKVLNHPSREQLEQIYDLIGGIFSVGRDYFQQRLDLDSSYDPATTWFATVNDVIASNVQIFPLHIRVGQASLKIGAIGSVATHPDYRGMGLAHKILNAQTEWMKQTDYDMSLLLAIKHKFYEKVGWKLIPEVAYSIENPLTLSPRESSEIIPFDPQYLNEMHAIYNQFNENRTYSVIRNETYWNDMQSWPDWKQSDILLLKKNNQIVAYGSIENKAADDIYINELVYAKEADKQDVEDLFVSLCHLRPQAKRILARVPEDHFLTAFYKEHNSNVLPVNISMWKMINYGAMFNKLQTELEQRLNNSYVSDHPLYLDIFSGGVHTYFNYEGNKLYITSEANPAHSYREIEIDEHELISYLIFGYRVDEANDNSELLQALFPTQQAVFYLTDKF